jgi:hypothetical protein
MIDSIVVTQDLILLSDEDRKKFYVQTCEAIGLDFRTSPLRYFEQIDRNGKRVLILYALRNASSQLAMNHGISVKLSEATIQNDTVWFTASASDTKGRTSDAIGAVSLKDLIGKAYADALMAAQTKAKRRAILDMAGHGLTDESEVEGMNGTVVEMAPDAFENYTPTPLPPVPTSAAATEVSIVDNWPIGKTITVEVIGPSIAPEIIQAGNDLRNGILEKLKKDITESTTSAAQYAAAVDALGPDMSKYAGVTEAEITLCLNNYRRDVLMQGGMKPSKGFGIAAKWSKFVSKRAPNKTIEEYDILLTALDKALEALGAVGVVAMIEKEIA